MAGAAHAVASRGTATRGTARGNAGCRSAGPVHHPFVTFDEWDSEADREAYAELRPGCPYPLPR
jgi:hypothetical protein